MAHPSSCFRLVFLFLSWFRNRTPGLPAGALADASQDETQTFVQLHHFHLCIRGLFESKHAETHDNQRPHRRTQTFETVRITSSKVRLDSTGMRLKQDKLCRQVFAHLSVRTLYHYPSITSDTLKERDDGILPQNVHALRLTGAEWPSARQRFLQEEWGNAEKWRWMT